MANMFLTKMIEEKDLNEHIFTLKVDGLLHIMDMHCLIQTIEESPKDVRDFIYKTISEIEFNNGDILEFLEFVVKSVIQNPVA